MQKALMVIDLSILMADIYVKGFSDLQKFLDTLVPRVEANIIRGALRAGAKPILEAARQNAPVGPTNFENITLYGGYTGALRDSIRISGRIDSRNGKVTASVKAGGITKRGADVFYAHMVEFGTRPHALSGFKREKNHPGTNPRPFMRPALDAQAGAAVAAAGEYIKKRLATKHGLDTSEINIELEE